MPVMGAVKFMRFFRAAAGLDVDRDDLKRYDDFINEKLNDMCVIGFAHANSNDRDVVESYDLPITAGLQHSIHEFKKLDHEIELAPILERLAAVSPDMTLSAAARAGLPAIVGGMSVALGRTIRIAYPAAHAAHTEQWERAFQVFDLLL